MTCPTLTLLVLLSSVCLHTQASPYPHSSFLVPRTNTAAAPNTNTTIPLINTTITDPTGADISSSFKIMLYRQNTSKSTTPDDSYHNKRSLLSPRQDYDPAFHDPRYREDPPPPPDAPLDYSIHTCGDMGNARFIRSECDHKDGVLNSLRTYTFWCKRYKRRPGAASNGSTNTRFANSWGSFGPEEQGKGTCAEDEICVNDWGSGFRSHQGGVAWCINVQLFVGYAVESGADARGGLGAAAGRGGVVVGEGASSLEGKRMSAVVSGADGKTPREVREMDVVTAGGMKVGECEGCVDLETAQFGKGTDGLRLEAVVGSAAGAVAAGVLWLAVLAG